MCLLWLTVAKGTTGALAGDGSVDPDLRAIHEDTLHTCGCQLRLLKGGAIDDCVCIEQDQVGLEAGSNQTAITNLKTLCGQ